MPLCSLCSQPISADQPFGFLNGAACCAYCIQPQTSAATRALNDVLAELEPDDDDVYEF